MKLFEKTGLARMQALNKIRHAIDYLSSEWVGAEPHPTEAPGIMDALKILMAKNNEVYTGVAEIGGNEKQAAIADAALHSDRDQAIKRAELQCLKFPTKLNSNPKGKTTIN